MIRYKVVRLYVDVAYSCYAGGNYQLAYKKDTIVTAEGGTMGLAVFETRYHAQSFLRDEFSFDSPYKIIRVNPIGRGKRYHFACNAQDTVSLDKFYHEYANNLSLFLKISPSLESYIHILTMPTGTIFYQQVRVLE